MGSRSLWERAYLDILTLCRKLCNKSSAVAEMGDLLAIDMGRQVGGGPVPLSVGDLGPHLTQCHLGIPPYQVAS